MGVALNGVDAVAKPVVASFSVRVAAVALRGSGRSSGRRRVAVLSVLGAVVDVAIAAAGDASRGGAAACAARYAVG